jgi:hypothetical protein
MHGPLKSGSNILQAKRHLLIRKCTPWIDKSCFMFIFGINLYLIVSRKTIHERKYLTACTLIDNLVNERGGEIILWTGLVQILEVHTYVNCSLLFVDRNGISHPLSELNGVDETGFEDFLYFSLNSCYILRINQTKLLSDRLGVNISRYFMFDDSWINAWHFLIRPG